MAVVLAEAGTLPVIPAQAGIQGFLEQKRPGGRFLLGAPWVRASPGTAAHHRLLSGAGLLSHRSALR